jgi:hypothetical protein
LQDFLKKCDKEYNIIFLKQRLFWQKKSRSHNLRIKKGCQYKKSSFKKVAKKSLKSRQNINVL